MCNAEVIEWFVDIILDYPEEFNNKRILELGSKSENGSVRRIIEKVCSPKEYVGIDMAKGKFVDLVLPAEKIIDHFGEESFDVVISTEMLEHVKDWRLIIDNIKKVLRPGGRVYITTRSYGFPYHGYPFDYWRYEESDMKKIFSDFKLLDIKTQEPTSAGLFLRAMKTSSQEKIKLDDVSLYSIAIGKRSKKISGLSLKRKCMLALRKVGLLKTVT